MQSASAAVAWKCALELEVWQSPQLTGAQKACRMIKWLAPLEGHMQNVSSLAELTLHGCQETKQTRAKVFRRQGWQGYAGTTVLLDNADAL